MSAFVNHRDASDNKEETPFEFTEENYEKIAEIMARYPSNYKHSAVIPLLMIAQKQNDNFLSLAAMNKVSKILEMAPMQVYEVASFYTMFNRSKVGKYHLQVCGTTPCMVRGAREVIEAMKEFAGVGMEEISADGNFYIQEVECLGACVNAPMMQVNNEWFYEDLTPESAVEVLRKFRDGEEVEVGPQNHRKNSEGPEGRTSLHEPEGLNVPIDRDFGKVKEEWEAARAAAAAAKK